MPHVKLLPPPQQQRRRVCVWIEKRRWQRENRKKKPICDELGKECFDFPGQHPGCWAAADQQHFLKAYWINISAWYLYMCLSNRAAVFCSSSSFSLKENSPTGHSIDRFRMSVVSCVFGSAWRGLCVRATGNFYVMADTFITWLAFFSSSPLSHSKFSSLFFFRLLPHVVKACGRREKLFIYVFERWSNVLFFIPPPPPFFFVFSFLIGVFCCRFLSALIFFFFFADSFRWWTIFFTTSIPEVSVCHCWSFFFYDWRL